LSISTLLDGTSTGGVSSFSLVFHVNHYQ
jgi:hypothetical protein